MASSSSTPSATPTMMTNGLFVTIACSSVSPSHTPSLIQTRTRALSLWRTLPLTPRTSHFCSKLSPLFCPPLSTDSHRVSFPSNFSIYLTDTSYFAHFRRMKIIAGAWPKWMGKSLHWFLHSSRTLGRQTFGEMGSSLGWFPGCTAIN